MTKYQKDPTCCIFLKRVLFKGIKNYIPMSQTRKYKNTNTQIHKYIFFTVADMSNKCYIFEKVMVRGPRKQSFHLSDMQIQIRKNTNTQILLWSKLQICPTYAIFSERKWYEDIKNKVPSCLTCKYKYTKTQTHKYRFGQSSK